MTNLADIPLEVERSPKPELFTAMRKYWHAVAYSGQLKDKPLGVTLLGESVVVARLNGEVRAMHGRCPHKGTALALGNVVEGAIECPYHGWRFDGGGKCVRVPAREELTEAMSVSVDCYYAAEHVGIIWVALEKPIAPLPEFAELTDPGFRVQQGPNYEWATSAPRRLENFVDFSHFPYVHDGTIGARESPGVETVKVWRDGHVLRFDRDGYLPPNPDLYKLLFPVRDADQVTPLNEYHISLPATVYVSFRMPNDRHYVLFMSASPVTENLTRVFWWQARDFRTEPMEDLFFKELEDTILSEDKAIIESQQPKWFSFNGASRDDREIPVRGADVVSVEYRRWLFEKFVESQNL
ncbi:aromatic ring-hydroxylating oxygenase subunit alpha [Paraburkholderia antibiotica]|uniref:Aromatic ring-hydroxylating dioxygenase subunit alpha n=1 Tax=Paraburkholderia antibiotica TaxID=2728839 RepID=A0A7X9X6F2_9BURK|nr:aromatic ring-hydroxylating dioxygenase subunit alpha [Paraburkholderia antibiotica]NML32368.1 aromatic ring-hydroxylating dioxygenase subunit alpha [Paraburkholderia antibiotica]